MSKLKNPRHEQFCQEYLKDLNATQAYVRVYKCKVSVADKNGSRLRGNAGVDARIKELMEKRTQRVQRDADAILRDIQTIKDRCMQGVPVLDENGEETGEWKFEPNPALKALELEGKHQAMWVDKIKGDLDVTTHKSIVDEITEED